MQRRDFLSWAATMAASAALARGQGRPDGAGAGSGVAAKIETVRGSIPPGALGRTLPHEHVLVDFVGADQVSASRYDAQKVFDTVLPHLRKARALGLLALFECTPAYLARDARLLKRLSEASDLHLVTNTGYYGARQNKFLPAFAHTETAEQLSRRWIAEAREGIDGAGIKPGFIKSGVDAEPVLSDVQRKLVSAAALTHAATGLTIAVHTGRGPGLEQLDVLKAHGVAPAAYVWVHAQGAKDDALFAAADRGAWISLDGLNRNSLTRHLHLCRELKQRGHLGRVLLSHDAGWYDPAKPEGGVFRGFELLFEAFLPTLKENGFSEAEIDRLTIANPAEAFTVSVRMI